MRAQCLRACALLARPRLWRDAARRVRSGKAEQSARHEQVSRRGKALWIQEHSQGRRDRGRRDGLWGLERKGRSLAAAIVGLMFSWEEQQVKDAEFDTCVAEFSSLDQQVFQPTAARSLAPSWETVISKPSFKLWRRPLETGPLYQYRVFGTYTDITPRQFLNVQIDTDYRKRWDELVIKLDILDRDLTSGSEVVHWVTQFPYPMYARDYVYVRRWHTDSTKKVMVLVSRSVEHPSAPEHPKYVRVRSYESHMVIRAHHSFDEIGFDYLLTYTDDPQTVFPHYCISWMVSSGMPDFLEKLHRAARDSGQATGRLGAAGATGLEVEDPCVSGARGEDHEQLSQGTRHIGYA
uniref:StAR-related lipid transfer protein 7, mitochondrial n=1 Tax=Eptatretus burgeri TaxID=7764 RepID=A0A8C4QP39_EPTBU